MLMPSIDRYMTRQPWTIRRTARLTAAQQIMREHHIRHLPVLEGGKLVGVVSERDLDLLGKVFREDPSDLSVEDAMTQDVYGATADTPADQVLDHMAERKLGSCVVMDRLGGVAGIFTTVDALEVFSELLRRETA
jgi:acetoin utilization protein AcuB